MHFTFRETSHRLVPALNFELAKEWGEHFSVWPQLHFLVYTFRIQERPQLLGTVLGLFANQEAQSFLERWETESDAANILLCLSKALAEPDSSSIFKSYPPLSSGLSPTQQFRKSLRSDFLIALAAEQLPPSDCTSSAARAFFSRARLWLFVHAFRLGKRGVLAEQNLRLVAQFFREAGNAIQLERTNLFVDLSFPIQSQGFVRLDDDFSYRAELLLSSRSILSPPLQGFLKAIIDVVNHVEKLENLGEVGNATIPNQLIAALPQRQSNFFPLQTWFAGRDEEGINGIDLFPDDGEGNDDVACTQIDENFSPLQQQFSSKSVLFASREDAQHLIWSWNRITPDEFSRLSDWIEKALAYRNALEASLAAQCWIALATAQSLVMTQGAQIEDETKESWRLDSTLSFLHRLPPRRPNGWAAKDHDAERSIASLATWHHLILPKNVNVVLQYVAKNVIKWAPKDVGQFWPADSEKVSAQFARIAEREGFGRVTQGMLGSWLPVALMNKVNDHVAVRLATAHPNSGLPGACAYPSWDSAQVSAMYASIGFELDAGTKPNANALGSRLKPNAELFKYEIEKSQLNLENQIKTESLVESHNAYIISVLMVLFAATGARPGMDPFECLRYFDLKKGFVFLVEKDSGVLRHTRIVPIPHWVCAILREFQSYLLDLARHLRDTNPILSGQIESMARGEVPAALPLFFLLRESDLSPLEWTSVTKTYLDRNLLPGSGLPAYVFRHCYSQYLHCANFDAEIIDGLMSHVDAGTPSYGDESPRVWERDMKVARQHLEAFLESLHLRYLDPPVLTGRPSISHVSENSGTTGSASVPRLFGEKLRDSERRKRLIEVIKDARVTVALFLNGKTLDQLSPDEIDSLSRKLLFTSSGRPHPSSGLRYRVLLQQIEAIWKKEGKMVRRHKHYWLEQSDAPFFTADAIGVELELDKARDEFGRLRSKVSGKTGAFLKAWLAVLGLALESSVAEERLLCDILSGCGYRVTVLKQRAYLERLPRGGVPEKEVGDTGVSREYEDAAFRIGISPHVAAWLSFIKLENAGSSERRLQSDIPEILHPIFNAISIPLKSDVKQVIKRLAEKIDQHNKCTRPGILAGYLSGRLSSFPLGWADWVRVETGRAIQCSGSDEHQDECSLDVDINLTAFSGEEQQLRTNARKLLHDLRPILKKACSQNTKRRRDLVTEALQNLETHRGKVSTAMYALGAWTVNILARINKVSSADRYLSALTRAFEAVMWNFDIEQADGDELIEKYEEVLEAGQQLDRRYIANRLKSFHRFASKAYALEDINWAELTIGEQIELGRPGIVLEDEYQKAHLRLQASLAQDLVLPARMLLLLVYRFGLRPNEAWMLAREELVLGTRMHVIVNNNKYRKLKRAASRRLVPLLYNLTDDEKALIAQVLTRSEAESGADIKAPLLGKIVSDRWLSQQIARAVSSALKMETKNPATVLYDCRHTFAMRAAEVLYGAKLDAAVSLALGERRLQADDFMQCLLGTCSLSRRGPWALARLMGHAGTRTAMKSYVNFMDRWADNFNVPVVKEKLRRASDGMLILDNMPDAKQFAASVFVQPARIPDMADVIRLIRLVTRGALPRSAALGLGLDPVQVEPVIDALCNIALKGKTQDERQKLTRLEAFRTMLSEVPESGWNDLLNFAKERQAELSANFPLAENVTRVSRLSEILGPTRQILLWRKQDFALVREAFDLLQVPQELYNVTGFKVNEQLEKWAAEHGMEIIPPDKLEGYTKPVKVDAAVVEDGMMTINQRCSILFKRNQAIPIRSRVMLVIVLMAWALAMDSDFLRSRGNAKFCI
ncbi:MAG: hypothetical protein H6R18_502 [Proteobacteria bacterium]|nr:hypothetical protein [Pseudomonadota bacterium]